MDGSNSVIDLYNEGGNLNHSDIEKKKKSDWLKMQERINNK